MSQVTLEALAERIEKLEQAMSRLLQKEGHGEIAAQEQPKKAPEPLVFKDWRRAVERMANMPPGNEEFRRAAEEAGRQWREEGRRAAIEEADREDAAKEGRG